ncbi:glycosyltransferase family 2 protein [Devosia submarina]|uniref:glycosyltransferase family 2 protein n=1 Tax=Devosia submarina TaxID=1173082 RepID=UPI000D3A5E64|nr:glycosyltransferase family 2 protein [Devosia submarina]
MHDLTIVVVNYRTGALTVNCLASVMADPSLPSDARIMVVDGGSGDKSSELITSAISGNGWGERIAFLELPENGGFAFGNNRAIEAANDLWGRAKAVLLLNPDTVVRPGAIGALTNFLDEHPEAGIVGSSLEDFDGTKQACSFRFPTALGELEGEARFGPLTRLLGPWCVVLPLGTEPSRAQWISGASMLVRQEVFQDIGGLDEEYFLYYEELDFCRRASSRGWQCWTVPASRIVHLCGQATGVSARGARLGRRPAYWFNSRNRYFQKHHSPWGRAAVDLAWMAGQAIWLLRQRLAQKPNQDPPFLVRDFLAHRTRRQANESI